MIETIVGALARHARERPQAVALSDDRARLTWLEAKAWVDRASGWLLALGLPRGSPVLGWLPNCAEWYLLRLACEQSGLFWVPIPSSQGMRELSSIAERVRPSVIATKGRFRERDFSADALEICSRLGLNPAWIRVPDDRLLSIEGSPADECNALRLEEPAHALASTGSEGIPKLALYTLDAACLRAHAQRDLLGLTVKDVLLVLSPGTGPARAAWLAAPVAGSRVVAMPQFRTDAALNLIPREGVTIVCGTPAQLAMLAAQMGNTDTSTVRIWYTAGSVLAPTLAADLEANTKGIVVSTYGGSDFGGWSAPDIDDLPAVRHRTVGRPRGGTEFRVVDPQDRDVPSGNTGELIGRGPCCVSAYLGEPGRDRWRDGWFHTGDLASLDKDGNIVIVGRLNEVIVRGGDKVSPAEVEALLRTVPGVAQVAVIGVPDAVLGERVCACVVLQQAHGHLDLEQLRRHLHRQGLALYKAPERMIVLDALPVVGDKIDRRALEALSGERAHA